mgnify:FL=1
MCPSSTASTALPFFPPFRLITVVSVHRRSNWPLPDDEPEIPPIPRPLTAKSVLSPAQMAQLPLSEHLVWAFGSDWIRPKDPLRSEGKPLEQQEEGEP